MENPDIGWKQRFANFKKALARLEDVANQDFASELEEEGFIQRFEYTYELAWKTMSDHLIALGNDPPGGPTPTRQLAASIALISDAEGWFKMQKARNKLSYDYDGTQAQAIRADILHLYLPLLRTLHDELAVRS